MAAPFTPVRSLSDVRTASRGYVDHPEAVAWHGGFVWCGTEAGRLVRIDPDTHETVVVAETGGIFLGITFDGDGRCYACDISRGAILRIDPATGGFDTFCDAVAGRRLRTPNFITFAEDGTMWVTESGRWFHTGDGFLFRIPPGGEPEIVDETARRWTNGLALTADGSRLYLLESTWPGLAVYHLEGGDVVRREEALPMPSWQVPDGLALDRDGNVYIACWRPDRVYRLSPDHERLEVYLDDPSGSILPGPTNLAFGGPSLSRLYVVNFSGWAIRELDADVPGQPLHEPRIP